MYWSDWLGRDPKVLTYGAKGLWIDMLAVMGNRSPQGVISGNLESLAESLGYVGPMARAWVSEYKPLIEELEQKGIFSRGRDVSDELEPDAIVSRRMYRDRDRSQEISEARSRAARIRWDGAKAGGEERVSLDEVRAEIAAAECKTDAKLYRSDANGMQTKIAEVRENTGDSAELPMQSDAKVCYSPAQALAQAQAQPTPTQPIGGAGGFDGAVVAVGACLPLLQPLTGKVVYDRLLVVTRDRGARAKWWNAVVNAFRKAGQLEVIDEHLRYVEEHGAGIRKPSPYLVKRVLASARELRVVVPDVPAGKNIGGLT